MEELNEGDLVLCTVKSIDRTTVFVTIEGNGEGTIITSEIAPGRIRNLREYVIPGKKIVCKILRIEGNNIHLSLRRVSKKEKEEVMEKQEKEKSALSILKSVLNEKAIEVAEKVKKSSHLHEFLSICKENPKKLEEYMKKEDAEKVCKILQQQKERKVEVKKEFKLSSRNPEGIKIIKIILETCKGNCEISYLAAGRYSMKITSDNYKTANASINNAIEQIEKKAKEKKADFSIEK